MDEQEKRRIINHLMHHSAHRVGIVFEFVTLCNAMMNGGVSVDPAGELTVTEVNYLLAIMGDPGITAAQLCQRWKRTRGAVSQILKKLEQKDYVYRDKKPGSAASGVGLYTTPAGMRIGMAVILNEREDSSRLFSSLLDRGCSQEDLEAFYRVMSNYIQILQEGSAGDWARLLPAAVPPENGGAAT